MLDVSARWLGQEKTACPPVVLKSVAPFRSYVWTQVSVSDDDWTNNVGPASTLTSYRTFKMV
jgi:hypothetical protein